jgi:isopentenyldiphosphate isomerase
MLTRTLYRLASFAKPTQNYNPKDEQVLIVDRENNPVGSATRLIMRQQKLIHRSTYIFVLNQENKLFVQKRTVNKDIFPGFYDIAPGGVILANDESDKLSALRELDEEMGIKTDFLEFCFNHFYEPGMVWCAVFLTRWDKELVLQPEEVQWVELMGVQEIFERSQNEEFCPDSLEILRILCDQGKIVRS